MGPIVDSSIFIAIERGRLRLEDAVRGYEVEDLSLAAVTAAELLHGVQRADSPERRQRRLEFVETVLARFAVLPFDLGAARVYADVGAQLATGGRTIGTHDLLIASVALSAGRDVLTRDQRSFPHVPGLRVKVV
jgi:predicted nucleic acid-binding protein